MSHVARVALTGTAAADPATVGPPGMRHGRPWNSSHRAHMQETASLPQGLQVPGYGTATFDLKHEKAAGDREPVQAAERSFVERTASRKEEPTEEQKDARTAARRAKKARQKANKAEKKAAAAAASEAERADYPHAQLRENVEMVAYSLPPEGGSGFGDLVYATVPLGSVATKVARDWLANELHEPSRRGKIDAACRDRKVADLITAAGASAPADAGRIALAYAPSADFFGFFNDFYLFSWDFGELAAT
ncbi:hypothetical protein EMIHUDRAFT_251140 [Emiliania huxleyi CCMP1516]|uniref:Uncharacterized protein n=2 Tax=Emiliania huxleyi TaxID=2903 RepID=A0A0D3KXH2_EMIH1|nr:hypothetical protein EMIHUDRAFT_251140 [Emiliania huxleyi CCMP1516]EOD40457.1 hypothetical protein EMIHUDRAFT_251140 [Emiliania huxleyi CCMP1516]|eukprot:XP_005792886.1 hypothetical protein EMIHUDRAFT_251140 [Emiliania huxleyi CCMP1516]